MTKRSMGAYDVSLRVESYDADMDVMPPNRSKMVQVTLEVLPFPKTAALSAIGLGDRYWLLYRALSQPLSEQRGPRH